jgi:hypothetical protein
VAPRREVGRREVGAREAVSQHLQGDAKRRRSPGRWATRSSCGFGSCWWWHRAQRVGEDGGEERLGYAPPGHHQARDERAGRARWAGHAINHFYECARASRQACSRRSAAATARCRGQRT